MAGHKFDPKNLARLDDPARLRRESPDLILDVARMPRPRVIVDLGAGSGFYAFPLARRVAPGGRVVACDTSPRMCDVLRSRVPEGLPVEVLQTDEVGVPLPDGQADLVLMANVFHELDDPAGSLQEARRLLVDGGILVVVDWKAEPTPDGPPVDHRIPAPVIVRALGEAGFRDVTLHDALPQHAVITAAKRRPAPTAGPRAATSDATDDPGLR